MLARNLGPREEYATVEIRFFPATAPGKAYPVEFTVLGWRAFPPCTAEIDQDHLRTLDTDAEAYGQALGQAIFGAGALGQPYGETIAAVQGRGEGLRVRLRLDPPELEEVRWERIYHPLAGEWRPLGSTAVTPFSRFVSAQQWDRPLPATERPLRMLAVIASPEGLTDYKLDAIDAQERQALHDTLGDLPDVLVTYLESGTPAPPTLKAIREALSDGYNLVHLLGHGASTPGGTVVYLEGEDGKVEPVTAKRLTDAFKAVQSPPALCFLAACESAKREKHQAHAPLGPALVEDGGVQAVVAMSDRVGLETAQAFAGQFYARLLTHGVIDLAVNEARALVQDEWDWGVPVLFSRLADNQLIDFLVGQFYDRYLRHADRAYYAADEALAAARLEDHGQDLVHDLEALIDELSNSHKVLVQVTKPYRRLGLDPTTFAGEFKDYYVDFKEVYDGHTWQQEETSCRRVREIGFSILPRVRPLLDDTTFDQLAQEIDRLGNADMMLIHYFREFLESMNQAVEEIKTVILAGDVDRAQRSWSEFEMQISPSFRRSKEMFDRMSSSITVMAAR